MTTKDNWAGLGLALCHSIAAWHNAKINIQSNSIGTMECHRPNVVIITLASFI